MLSKVDKKRFGEFCIDPSKQSVEKPGSKYRVLCEVKVHGCRNYTLSLACSREPHGRFAQLFIRGMHHTWSGSFLNVLHLKQADLEVNTWSPPLVAGSCPISDACYCCL